MKKLLFIIFAFCTNVVLLLQLKTAAAASKYYFFITNRIFKNPFISMEYNINKYFLASLFFLFGNNVTYCQSVAINNNGSLPNPKAMLDIQSADKGILIPKVLLIDSNNPISGTKPLGLMVWNDNQSFKGGKGFYFWNGNIWQGVTYYAGEAIAIDSTNKITALYNSINQSGIVPAPTILNKNATYITDSNGNPKWKTENKTMYYINKF
jgi:hypothetical protein